MQTIAIDCPRCDCRLSIERVRDITPTRPLSCECRKCFHVWDFCVTEERYAKVMQEEARMYLIKLLENMKL